MTPNEIIYFLFGVCFGALAIMTIVVLYHDKDNQQR